MIRRSGAPLALALALCAMASAPGYAQTDYYNTDRGRPVQVEDAYVAERYAVELKIAPVRLERSRGAAYAWEVEPEIAYGILPRTQIEIGLPLVYREHGTERSRGVAGLELSAMHNLNHETEGWPALGIRGDLLLPVGNLGPARTYPSLTGIATRTQRWGRIHLNAQVTAGSELTAATEGDAGGAELSRWLVGAAIDRTFPLRSTLVTAEFYGSKPLMAGEPTEYLAGVGTRYQVSPTVLLDAGVGRTLNGDDKGWYLTFGSSYAFGIASLFPVGR